MFFNTASKLALAVVVSLVMSQLGCVGADDLEGRVEICFATPGDDPDSTDSYGAESDIAESITGDVVFHRTIDAPEDVGLNCDATRALRIDSGGQMWTVGYRANDSAGNDITPETTIADGQTIRLSLERRFPWWIEHAFAIERDGALVLAMNDGLGANLPANQMGGLRVEEGGTYAKTSHTCGRISAQKLEFCGDRCTTLKVGERGELELGSNRVQVRNVVAYDFVEQQCDDITDIDAWMAWQK